MNAPDKIYLQVCGECPEEDCKNCKFEDLEDNVTWCKDRIYKKDIEYIRKDALLEWAKDMKAETEGVIKQHPEDESLWAEMHWWEVVMEKINAM